MQNTSAQPNAADPDATQKRNWLLPALVIALVITLLVSLIAIGGYFLLKDRSAGQSGWQDPLAAIDAGRVRADLPALLLLDESPTAVIKEALETGETDSAYAVLAYSPDLSDAERIGNLLLVAHAFEADNAPGLAALCYQQMHSLAALSSTLPDIARSEASLEAAAGLIRLDMSDAARPSLAQAEALARYSSLLAPVKRQEIAQRLLPLYEEAGFDAQAANLSQLLRDPQGLPDSRLVRGPFLPDFQAEVVYPRQLIDARDERLRQTAAFLEAWDAGDDMEAARSALASALLQEDGVRQAVFAAEIEAATQLSGRAAWIQERVNWLTLKYMIARQGMGFNLAPEWALEAETIRAELDQAYADLFLTYGDLVATLPEAADISFAGIELLRTQLLLGRLGLYIDYPEEALIASLDERQTSVQNQLPLLVVHEPWGDGVIFRLAESFE